MGENNLLVTTDTVPAPPIVKGFPGSFPATAGGLRVMLLFSVELGGTGLLLIVIAETPILTGYTSIEWTTLPSPVRILLQRTAAN